MEDEYDYLSQLDEDVASTESDLEEASASAEPGFGDGALPYGADIRAEYEAARKGYESSTQSVLDQIQKARDLLLSQPTQKSKGEYLRGLAMTLAAPRERNDPRFYEKRNLYTFLRDVGEYGTAEKEAQRKAELLQKEQMLKLDELASKYGQQSSLERLRAVAPLYREMMKPKRQERPPANVQEVQYYEAILADPNASPERKKFAQAMLDKMIRLPTEPVSKPNWNEQILAARMRVKEGKGTPRDLEIIAMSERGQGGLTTAQARMDKRIKDAQEFLKTVNERERAAAFAAPYPNERQQRIRKAVELAGQPLYEDVAKSGGFSAEPISDEDEG